MSCLYILEINPLLVASFANFFSQEWEYCYVDSLSRNMIDGLHSFLSFMPFRKVLYFSSYGSFRFVDKLPYVFCLIFVVSHMFECAWTWYIVRWLETLSGIFGEYLICLKHSCNHSCRDHWLEPALWQALSGRVPEYWRQRTGHTHTVVQGLQEQTGSKQSTCAFWRHRAKDIKVMVGILRLAQKEKTGQWHIFIQWR